MKLTKNYLIKLIKEEFDRFNQSEDNFDINDWLDGYENLDEYIKNSGYDEIDEPFFNFSGLEGYKNCINAGLVDNTSKIQAKRNSISFKFNDELKKQLHDIIHEKNITGYQLRYSLQKLEIKYVITITGARYRDTNNQVSLIWPTPKMKKTIRYSNDFVLNSVNDYNEALNHVAQAAQKLIIKLRSI